MIWSKRESERWQSTSDQRRTIPWWSAWWSSGWIATALCRSCGLKRWNASCTVACAVSASIGHAVCPGRGVSSAWSTSHTTIPTTICTTSMFRDSSACFAACSLRSLDANDGRTQLMRAWKFWKSNCERMNAEPPIPAPADGGSHCSTSSAIACSQLTLAATPASRFSIGT